MSKTRNMMRSDLRLDLKDSGTLWSNAELDRAIEKAHADFSRYCPREKFYEESLQFAISAETITSLATTSLTAVVSAQSIDVAAGSLLTIAGQPDLPRPLILTIVDANNSTYGATFVIRGMDKDEIAQTEILHYSRGDSKTILGKKEFKYVYEVELESDSGSGAGDTLSVGYGLTTTGWVYLAYKPIRYHSETITSSPAGTTYARNTDYYIDYANGRIKLIAGGSMAASTAYLVSYGKDRLTVDLSNLTDFIRVERVEYPVGSIPKDFTSFSIFGKQLIIGGDSESGEQSSMSEDSHVRIHYSAEHQVPNDDTPGSVPEFLENTIIMASGAYALFIYALKCEHQALTDLATARTAIGSAATAQSDMAAILTAISTATSAGSTSLAGTNPSTVAQVLVLSTGALAKARAYVDAVAAGSTGDLTLADDVAASYIGAIDLVAGATEPSIKAYLTTGDALLNTIAKGGENERTPEMYGNYAQVTKAALVAAYEQHRAFYQQNATARTNAAMAYVQEAAQYNTILSNYIGAGSAYASIGQVLVGKANALLAQIAAYLQEAAHSLEAANGGLVLADRFKADATTRRDEVYAIWHDRKEYIGDLTSASMNQFK